MIKNKEEYVAAIKQLNKWTQSYDLGMLVVSDKEWDDLYFAIEKYELDFGYCSKESPTQKIHFKKVSSLRKVKHNHLMLSLDKTKDWNAFLDYFKIIASDKKVVKMLKLDGLTCSLKYENGLLIAAETRGNGEVGEDILHNVKVMKSVPKKISYKENLVVDGEILCTNSDFVPFEKEYKNPRNFAAGSIRLLNSKECYQRKLTFVAWNVIAGFNEDNSFLSKMKKIEDLGFITVPIDDNIKDKNKDFDYPTDGIVGRFDDINFSKSLGATEHHERGAYAFKFYDDLYKTNLKTIKWTIGRTGVLTPIAVFNPVEIEGSTVNKASLHNFDILKETLHGFGFVGQELEIYKANMIIPQIYSAQKNEQEIEEIECPVSCPYCGGPLKKESVNLVCINLGCRGKLINKMVHFCGKNGLDIKGLSEAILEKLIEWKWIVDFKDIFELANHKRKFLEKPGFGEKSVNKILDSIFKATRTELWRVISAAGIPLVGVGTAKNIAKYFGSWNDFKTAIYEEFDFTKLPDIGENIAKNILNHDYLEMDIVVKRYLSFNHEKVAGMLKEKNFVITGKLHYFKNRNELKEKIESLGGRVLDSVSSKTNYLINNDLNSTSSKNKKAKELNIPIITEEKFLEMTI